MDDIKISGELTSGKSIKRIRNNQDDTKKQWQSIMNNIDNLTRAVNTQISDTKIQNILIDNSTETIVPPEQEQIKEEAASEAKKTAKIQTEQNNTEINFNDLITKKVKVNTKKPKQEPQKFEEIKTETIANEVIQPDKPEKIEEIKPSIVNLKDIGIPSKDTYFLSGELKTREFNVKDLKWSRRNNDEWNKKCRLVDSSVSSTEVKNKKDKIIAHFVDGKFYVKNKKVSMEKFQKYTHSKGKTMTVTYTPDIPIINTRGIKTSSTDINKDLRVDFKHQISTPAPEILPDPNSPVKQINSQLYEKIKDIADKLNCNHQDLMAIINAESGFNPKARNKFSGATGLIQFMPKTARGLGTSIDELADMSAIEQLDYVEQYLQSIKKAVFRKDHALSGAELYALIFLPKNAGKEALAFKGHPYYDLNKGLDLDGDGIISKEDLKHVVRSKYINVEVV